METPDAIDRELDRFAGASTARERSEALKSLFTWNIPQAREPDPRIALGVDALLRAAENGDERLEAVAALGRLVRGVKANSPQLINRLGDAIAQPLPSAAGWADADERLFVSRAVDAVRPDWSIPYSAGFLTADDSAPKARDVFAEILVSQTGTIETALRVLAHEATPTGVFERDVRQLRSIIHGLRASISLSIDVGADAAAEFAGLVGRYIPRAGGTADRKLRIDAARDVLTFISLLLRGSLAGSFKSESYDALKLVRAWFAPARWPDELEQQVRDLRDRLAEAVEALALRGTPDDGLFRVLETAVGRDETLAITRRILDRPGVPETVHGWLRSGPGAPQTKGADPGFAAEASLRKADPMIARSVLAVRALQAELAENRMEPSAEMTTAASAARSERLVHEVIQAVRTIAAMRGLRLEGTVGEVVEFEPSLHRLITGALGTVKVRIVQPAVIRQVGSGPPAVVQQAVVEPA